MHSQQYCVHASIDRIKTRKRYQILTFGQTNYKPKSNYSNKNHYQHTCFGFGDIFQLISGHQTLNQNVWPQPMNLIISDCLNLDDGSNGIIGKAIGKFCTTHFPMRANTHTQIWKINLSVKLVIIQWSTLLKFKYCVWTNCLLYQQRSSHVCNKRQAIESYTMCVCLS